MIWPAYLRDANTTELNAIPRVPRGWRVAPFKTVFRQLDEKSVSGSEELLSVSAYTGISAKRDSVEDGEDLSRAESLAGYRLCQPGDLVVNIMLAWNCGLGVSPLAGIVSPSYAVFRPNTDLCVPRFYHYLLRTDLYTGLFKQCSTGVIASRLRIYPETMLGLPLVIPPVDVQREIVAYLDSRAGRIDTLIGKKSQFIDLLIEKRHALITHSVTRGLSSGVPMKNSGAEWLGQIPAHWAAPRLRFVCDVTTGGRDTADAVPGGKYPFYVRSQEVRAINTYSADCEAVLTAGDGAGVGKVFHYVNGKFDFHQRVYMVSNFRGVSGVFFFHYLKALFAAVALDGGAKSTVDSLRMPVFMNFPIALPPLQEQDEIIRYIETATARIDGLIAKTQRSIDLLKEHRTALVTAAVTGQINLREAA